jgi:hypothetical protein
MVKLRPRRYRGRREIGVVTGIAAASALALGGCQTVAVRPTLTVPDSLRATCERPNPEGVATVGDLAAYSLKQDAAIRVCDARRAAVVAIVDSAQPKKKRWPWGS